VFGRKRDGQIGPADESKGHLRALAEPDGTTALSLWVDAALPVYERTSAIGDAGRSVYASDPYLADWVRSEGLRLEACAHGAVAR
jgi:hypothetical protein